MPSWGCCRQAEFAAARRHPKDKPPDYRAVRYGREIMIRVSQEV